jgi:hypothetical protein
LLHLVLRLRGDIGHFEENDIKDHINRYLECEETRMKATKEDIDNLIQQTNGKSDARFEVYPAIDSL